MSLQEGHYIPTIHSPGYRMLWNFTWSAFTTWASLEYWDLNGGYVVLDMWKSSGTPDGLNFKYGGGSVGFIIDKQGWGQEISGDVPLKKPMKI